MDVRATKQKSECGSIAAVHGSALCKTLRLGDGLQQCNDTRMFQFFLRIRAIDACIGRVKRTSHPIWSGYFPS